MDIENLFYNQKFDELLEKFARRALGDSALTDRVVDLKKDIEKTKPLFNQFKDSKFKSLFKKFNDEPTSSGLTDPNKVSNGIKEQQPDRDPSEIFDMVALFNDIFKLNRDLPKDKEEEKLTESLIAEELFESVGQDKRVGVKHLYAPGNPQQIKPDQLLELIEDVSKNGGKINSKNSKITEKTDGQNLKFGLNEGVPFVETSYSGLIYDFKDYEKSFIQKVKSKGGELDGAKNYISKSKTAFEYFLKDKPLLTLLRTLGKNVKVFGELFNRSLANKSSGRLQFVGIAYDDKWFGTLGAFAIHEIVIEGNKVNPQEKRKLKKEFSDLSDSRMSWLDDEMPDINVNLQSWLKAAKRWVTEYYPSIKSLKRDEKEKKQEALSKMEELLAVLNEQVKNQIKDGGKWGPAREGVILKLPSGIYKITSQEFKDFKKSQKEDLKETLEIKQSPRGILRPYMRK